MNSYIFCLLQVEAFKRDREFRQRQLRDDEQQRQQQMKGSGEVAAAIAIEAAAENNAVATTSEIIVNGEATVAQLAAAGHPTTIAVGQLSLADLEKALAKVVHTKVGGQLTINCTWENKVY